MPTWDELFRDEKNRWDEPHEQVISLADRLQARAFFRVLDLGCGAGRHLAYLASRGFTVDGMDISPNGLRYTRERLIDANLPVRLSLADMTDLPYAGCCFDAIVSTYVIHHNREAGLRKTISEIWRLLKPGGVAFITIPSIRGGRNERGEVLEPGTVIPFEGLDAGVPHHYSSLAEVADFFAGYIVRMVQLNEHMVEGRLSSHWEILAEKPG